MSEHDEELQKGLLSGSKSVAARPAWYRRTPQLRKLALICACCLAAVLFYLIVARRGRHPRPIVTEREQRLWAQYSPYHAVAQYREPPAGCKVTQANILQRHGSRFPTTGATRRILTALNKLQAVRKYEDSRLAFVKSFSYTLGVNDLVPYGADESFKAGEEAFLRYANIVDQTTLPFVRSDISERDIDSANNWTTGFASASNYRYHPALSVILDSAGNDTLDDSQCPAAGSSEAQTSIWLSTFTPNMTTLLNSAAPGANLTDRDTFNLMTLCPFHSIVEMQKSPWCSLFEAMPGAFIGFEYMGDLDKYYYTGYGQPLGPVQGVGYINELLARLTNMPVRDNTQVNHTLDDSPATFPLNRTVYVDFTHDNLMIPVFAAMGLFRQAQPLDPRRPDDQRTWRTSAMVPFAARMVVERVECDRSDGRKTMVRILVQDEVQKLEGCNVDSDGLCELAAFVNSQSYARHDGDGDWEKCTAFARR